MKLFVLPLLALASAASADVCTPAPSTPACPTSGVQILDDTYPVQALVISQLPMARTEQGRALPRRTIVEAMRAFNFELDRVPYMIYPAGSGDLTTLRTELLRDLTAAGVSRERATELLNQRLRAVDTEPYTWQQDYFESSFDPSNGQPQIRYSEVYEDHWPNGQRSAEAIGRAPVCQLSSGENLRSFSGGKQSTPDPGVSGLRPEGEYGGNIEGLPGGLCLVGDNASTGFANQICGSSTNIVRAEVNWLEVGHVDEVFKVVPRSANDGRPAECAFSILAADTELGLSLLSEEGVANSPVLDRPIDPALTALTAATPGFSRTNRVTNPITNSPAYKILCDVLESTSGPGQEPAPRQGSEVRSTFLRLILDSAYAQDSSRGSRRTRQAPEEVVVTGKPAAPTVVSPEDERIFRCVQNQREVSHREFSTAIRDRAEYAPLRAYNVKIQEAMNRSKERMFNQIIGRLPQCRQYFPNVDSMFTKVPNYFSPPEPLNVADHMTNGELETPGAEAMSLFPNPTNGVLLNRSLMVPGPVPQGYQNYLQRTLTGLGLTTVPMDTWDYAHAGSGNLHCASHTLPYCRPGGR